MPRLALLVSAAEIVLSLALAAACSSATLTDSRVGPTQGDAGSGGDPGDDDGGADDGASRVEGGSSGSVGSPPPSTANATVVIEPGDNALQVLNAVKNAKKSIHVTMYLLSSSSFLTALVDQKKAGRDVKVVLNQTFPDSTSSNQAAFDQLKNGGVSVAWAPPAYQFSHAKCVILDGSQAWVMTMNLTYSSPDNREFLAIDSDASDVSQLESVFADDFANHAHQTTGNLIVSPLNSSDRLAALINSAHHTIDLEVETLSDDTITSALVAAEDRGVDVRIVLSDAAPTAAQTDSVTLLKQHHVGMVTLHTPYVHAKAIVVDGTLAYVGSANLTTTSLKYNRELGLILSTKTEVTKVGSTIASDFGNGTAL